MPSFAVTNRENAFLTETDGTAVSFRVLSIAMIACVVILHAEANTVKDHRKASIHVSHLVTLVVGAH